VLAPGETYWSALVGHGAEVERRDFSEAAWEGPPPGAFSWWKARVPLADTPRQRLAPNDVMLELFERWESEPDKVESRYVLALLLVRRRVLRIEESSDVPAVQAPCDVEQSQRPSMVVYCPRRESTYRVCCQVPSEARIEEIQEELRQLLVTSAA
jgi:hypothetical protein